MRTLTAWTVVTLLSALAIPSGSCIAGESHGVPGPKAIMDLLAGTAVSTAELGREQARGIAINQASSDGLVSNNFVGSRTVTGTINNTNSINNNVGITTVFQNTGNNSLFQSSTSILISIH